MKIEKGDYVSLKGLTEEQYHEVAKVFISSGFDSGEYPNPNYLSCETAKLGVAQFGLFNSQLYHSTVDGNSTILDGRELSIDELLKPTPKHWDGKGEPEVGQEVMVEIALLGVSKRIMEFNHKAVKIVGKFNTGDGLKGIVIYHSSIGHTSITDFKEVIKPIKSEREIAIEELNNVIGLGFPSNKLATSIYDAGYRKVEVK